MSPSPCIVCAIAFGASVLFFAPSAAAQTDDLEVPSAPSAASADAGTPPPTAPVISPPVSPAAAQASSAAPIAAPVAAPAVPVAPIVVPFGLVITGYIQAQYQGSQLSEDQLQQGGTPLNRDGFVIRRARIRFDRDWEIASTTLEVDGNTTHGAAFGLRLAEASILYRNPDPKLPPYLRVTAGLSEIPFGVEMTESSRSRFFMERTASSLAVFPSDTDVGLRVSGGLGFFRYSVAYLNGVPIDDRPGTGKDPTAAKDLVARVGIDTHPRPYARVTGGVSFLTGKGFHAGNDATKNQLVWNDLNENNVVDQGELTAIPGTAATPSQTFDRWAIGADLGTEIETRIGKTRVYGELLIAQNADRGVFIADPVATGSDARELGYNVALLQDVTRFGVVGFRMDYYVPNSDFFDSRGGKQIPADSSIRTFSPLAAVVLRDRVRLLFQYDKIVDSLARDARGVPTDLRNDQFTLRLQGEL